MPATLRIAIVGCGTAGPAAAIVLARQGHHVHIIERAAPLQPVGAGLLLQPTGMSVLRHLGLLDTALALGHRIDRLQGHTTSGHTVLDLAYADLAPGIFGLGIHRGALFTLLRDAALREPHVTITPGVAIAAIRQSPRDATLVTADRRTLGPFDLVVIADGAKSRLRDQLDVGARTQMYDFAAAWCVLPAPSHPRWQHTLRQVYRDTRSMVGYLPSGSPSPAAPPTLSLFWSLPADHIAATRAQGIAAFERRIIDLDPHAAPLLTGLTSMSDVVFATYHDVRCDRVFHHRAVLLGDAAHAMSPQLGQGANLALVDALSLAHAISRTTSRDDIPDALARHDDTRRAHTAFYAHASRWLTPWFQSDLTPLAPLRDAAMRPLSRIPFIKRQMALSLCGVKSGLFSHTPLPD